MALFSVAPSVMKPVALVLNILVAGLASVQFARAGHFRWGVFWPFVVTSAPMAFLGGSLQLPVAAYKPIVGAVLLYAAVRLALPVKHADGTTKPVPIVPALALGVVLGFVSGLVGVGGGIFLSPLLLGLRWAGVKETSATSALFILVNSAAGLLGHLASVRSLPPQTPLWAVAAVAGGALGATLGARRLPPPVIRRLLAVVLVVAGGKLMLGG